MKLQVFGSPYKKDVLVGTESTGTIKLQSIKGRSVGEAKEIGDVERKSNSFNLDILILIKRISRIKNVTTEVVSQRFDSFDLDDDITSDFLPEIKDALSNQGTQAESRVLAVTLMIKNRLVIEEGDSRKVGNPDWTIEDTCTQLSEELANEVYSFYLAESAKKEYIPSDKVDEGNEKPMTQIQEEAAIAA